MVLFGSLTNIGFSETKKSLGFAHVQTKEVIVELSGRLINVENGEIMAIADGTGKKRTERKMAMGATIGNIDEDETMINAALDEAIEDLAKSLAKEIQPG